MVWQLSNSIRDISPEQAVSLEIASDGIIDAAKACPDFFERLKQIGFERKQGLTWRPHMARKPHLPLEAVTLLRLPPWKAELLRKAAHNGMAHARCYCTD